MYSKIKNKVESELAGFVKEMEGLYSLSSISSLLSKNIKDFILRGGKRVRPVLFIMGYLGFNEKPAPGLYRSALSIELLHDFMLIHDDIIDKSDTRRGKPSMHRLFKDQLRDHKSLKFSGEDLAIVTGDVLYAMALHVFLSVREEPARKEAALKKIIKAALYTGSGEFLELINGLKNLDKLTREDIYKVYDLKTANYTFASPLSAGATLGGAANEEASLIYKYGIYLGRAFQIKDDILGLFENEKKTGKSSLADIKEAKKTILIWNAYKNSGRQEKRIIEKILGKKNAGRADLLKIRKIVRDSGALDYAKNQINELLGSARSVIKTSAIRPRYKDFLINYSEKVLRS
ncbi:MAG: polyprenyl synthetase family protein [Candidatus Omnitrophica bacterium]|nr:polyprenyl synthetase family protein [Candidatus Omnitrophota bacterium]MDD5654522.1 polyprenyl synthetase family protein [Candidatus Omnitrophota bacterium]